MFAAFRLHLRVLGKTPAFTLIALVTLALGIGVNTSMYTLVDVLLFRSAPFPEPDRIVNIAGTTAQSQRDGFSFAEIEEMRAQAAAPTGALEVPAGRTLASLTALGFWSNTLSEPGKPAERLTAIDATADFFKTFGVQPMLGRAFTADEQVPGRNQVALLSYKFWQTRFGGDPAVVGQTLRLNAEQVTIIGVMPASFDYPLFWGKIDLFRPVTIARHIVDDRTNHFFLAIGRLAPGATMEQARAQIAPLAVNWARDYPKTSQGRGFRVEEIHKLVMDDVGRFIIWFMFGIGGVVLLIACSNLANLQLARATAGARDLAVRSALGASRSRLIGYQLGESLVLALGGGLCGIVVASWVNALLGNAIRLGDAGGLKLEMNAPVLLVAFGVSVLTSLLVGLIPAWIASRTDVVATLKQQSRGSTSGRASRFFRQALIVAQVAFALALLGVAGVMLRGFDAQLNRNNGWDTARTLLAVIHLPEQSTYRTEDSRRVAIEKLERGLARIPGAEATAICSTAPLFGYSSTRPLQIEGQTGDDPTKLPLGGYTMVSGGYFSALGIPFLEGGPFSPDLRADHTPVVIIGETLARKFWPGQSALGKRIGERVGDQVVQREVVGVVRDIQFALNITNPDTMFQLYKPLVHEPWGYLNLVVRGASPAAFKNDVRRVVADIDPDVAVQELFTIPEASDRYQHNIKVVNETIGGFALLGLVLASVGLYGVISHLVAQRTGEFGIRLALGARPSNVLRVVLGSGLRLTALGLGLGVVLAFAIIRALGGVMPRMVGSDPSTLLATAGVLAAVALFACWVPARRATKIDPLQALRAE